MKIKRKHVYVLAAVGVIMFFILLVVNAYGTSRSTDRVNNRFVLSTLEGKITEEFEEETDIEIGSSKEKDIWIANTGNSPFFVRVMIVPIMKSATGELLSLQIGKEFSVDLSSDWKAGEDGFYYYIGKVEPQQKTSSLFTTVSLTKDLDSEIYGDADFSIQVKCETVTSALQEYRNAWWAGDVPDAAPLQEIDQLLADFSN